MPEVSCKTVAMQNSSQWPCFTCPIPQFRLVRMRRSYLFIFSGHPEVWTPLQIPISVPPCLHPVTRAEIFVCFVLDMSPATGTVPGDRPR